MSKQGRRLEIATPSAQTNVSVGQGPGRTLTFSAAPDPFFDRFAPNFIHEGAGLVWGRAGSQSGEIVARLLRLKRESPVAVFDDPSTLMDALHGQARPL